MAKAKASSDATATVTSTVCLVVRNEKPYLIEWLAWYRALGFDHIVVYDNMSSDGSDKVLEALAGAGKLDYRPWRLGRRESPQVTALRDALPKLETDWVFFADIDEFLVLHNHATVTEFLATVPDDAAAVGVSWRMFGDSFQKGYDPAPVVKRFVWASELAYPANRHVKSFSRVGAIEAVVNRHFCKVDGAIIHPSGAVLELSGYGLAEQAEFDVAQLNHYYTKTYPEYRRKMARGQAGVGEIDAVGKYCYDDVSFREHNINNVMDKSALAFLPAMQREFDVLAALVPAKWLAVSSDLRAAGAISAVASGAAATSLSRADSASTTSGDFAGLEALARELRLFDPDYYAREIGDDMGEGVDLFEHYMTHGHRRSANPSERFSTRLYYSEYPAVLEAGLNPLYHYLVTHAKGEQNPFRDTHGNIVVDPDKLNPNLLAAFFDADFYSARAGIRFGDFDLALRHYLESGWLDGLDPSVDFSTRQYLMAYRDVADYGINPLAHFCISGIKEGRHVYAAVDAF